MRTRMAVSILILLCLTASIFIFVSCSTAPDNGNGNGDLLTVTGMLIFIEPMVADPVGSTETADIAIALSDIFNPEYTAQVELPDGTWQFQYTIENVAPGTYLIGASIDVDGLPGFGANDYLGAYGGIDPTTDPPNAVVAPGSTTFNITMTQAGPL